MQTKKPILPPKVIHTRGIAKKLAKRAKIPDKKAEQALEATFLAIRGALRHHYDVRIPWFGIFFIGKRKTVYANNPRINRVVTERLTAIPLPRFWPSPNLLLAIADKNYPICLNLARRIKLGIKIPSKSQLRAAQSKSREAAEKK